MANVQANTMSIVFWLKGQRGLACLRETLAAGFVPRLLVLQNQPATAWYDEAQQLAKQHDLVISSPNDPNSERFRDELTRLEPDLFILAGYGKILRSTTLAVARRLTINLHGGKLPQQRGSAPLNWALINGEPEFGISIIEVDSGVDTGPVLAERRFPIDINDTIADLHEQANAAFPVMLIKVLHQLAENSLKPKQQNDEESAYYPVRFPDDGLILFDQLTAREVHDRIRALTHPYPGAFTFFEGRKVLLWASRLHGRTYGGQPGRIYQIKNGQLLVCAKDECLWLTEAQLDDDESPLHDAVARYAQLATVAQAAQRILSTSE